MTLTPVYETYAAIAPAKFAGKLNGKVVVVTGSSSGIGAAIAKAFAVAGASVAAISRREDELNAVVETIKGGGGKAIAFPADVTDIKRTGELIDRIEKTLGPVDIVINNAGIMRISPLAGEPADLSLWWKVYETNVLAPVALIHAVLPSMIARKAGGIVMSTTSKLAAMNFPAISAYGSSKAAITKFHSSLVAELQGTNILSFTVDPGQVKTNIGTTPTACNMSEMGHPAMQQLFEIIGSSSDYQTPELCADTMVALCADPRAASLNGCFVSADQDLSAILEETSKENRGRVGGENLYAINIPTL